MSPFSAAPSLATRLLQPYDDVDTARARHHAELRRTARRARRRLGRTTFTDTDG